MPRFLATAIWYAILAYGTWRALSFARQARQRPQPIDQARGAAHALGVAGVMLWCYAVRDEARAAIDLWSFPPDVMTWLGLLGASIIWGLLLLTPMWLPYWLLAGRPGSMRCSGAAILATLVSVFAGACIAISPFMLGFSNSIGEFLGTLAGIAIPLLVLIVIASTTATLARRVHAA